MKLSIIMTAFVGLVMSSAQATTLDSIIADYNNKPAVLPIEGAEVVGGYIGECFEGKNYQFAQREALYYGKFQNANGEVSYLPVSTEILYNNYAQPSFVAEYQDTAVAANWDKMAEVTSQGLSGSDNNLEKVAAGVDFKYLYTANQSGSAVQIATSRASSCEEGFVCNPPMAVMCRYGFLADGTFAFDNCVLHDDATIFKKIAPGVLVSKRTAKGWDLGPNNLTPDIGADSYCRWTLKASGEQVPAQYR